MTVIVIFREFRWAICSIFFHCKLTQVSIHFKAENSLMNNFAQNPVMDTCHGNMEFQFSDTAHFWRVFFQETLLMESAQSHRQIVSLACFSRKPERATDNGIETKNQYHKNSFPELLLSSTLQVSDV